MRTWLSSRVLAGLMALMLVGASATAAHADPRDFQLINGSDRTIDQIYVAPSNMDDWGDDILGLDVLPPGQTVTITFQRFTPGDCYYDIKVVAADGGEGELNQVNLCETTTVTFN